MANKFVGLLICILLIPGIRGKIIRHDDICGEFNGRRMYVDLEEFGVLEAKNQTNEDNVKRTEKSHQQCSLELITCPSCIIYIKFIFLNISRNCGKNSVLDSCGCDYVWIYEPPFEEVSGEQFCGHFVHTNTSTLNYKSQTRSTAITFFYSSYHQHAFTLEYTSKRSRHVLDGYPKYSNLNGGVQYISSPFFPYYYPRDLNTEYVINCKSSDNCRVKIIFTDFQISSSSLIEFFDWNGQRMYVTTGTIFRPPLLISSGPSMVIRFYANGGTNLGFKASYIFLLGDKDNSTLKADTDCGGYVDNLGGMITMMNMIKDHTKSYDCFWIIRPPENYLHLKTQLYLKVLTFLNFAGSTDLIIRQGLTSNEPTVETLRHPTSHNLIAKQKEHIVPISQGFYVSLKGLLGPESRLAIVYSAFNYKDCYSGSDFLCRNLRCIPAYLMCDGLDHCGDNSDETSCLEETGDRSRWSHTPNFFFPKIDRYSYLKTATIIFVVCSLGLICLIFALIILLYRINNRSRNQRQLQTHLQTINDMLEEGNAGVTEEEIVITDDPPNYEAPPDYDDVLKMIKYKAKKKSTRDAIKTRIRPCSRCDNVSIGRSIANSDYNEDNSLQVNFDHACTNRSCQTTPLPESLPRSPPPKYVLSAIEIRIPITSTYDHRILEENINENTTNLQIFEQCSTTPNELTIASNTESISIASANSDITTRDNHSEQTRSTELDNLHHVQNIIMNHKSDSISITTEKRQVKYLSLQNVQIRMEMPRRIRSASVNLNTLVDLISETNAWKNLTNIPSKRKICMSDSNLVTPNKTRELNEINTSRHLRRSASYENLFNIQ